MTTCHDIQLWWELPSIAHFCSLFRAAFNLLDFDIEDLEEAILTDGLDGSGSPLLVELLVRLLQGCLPGRTVTPSNIDSCLRKLFRQKCQENLSWKNLLPEGDFRSVSLRRKVEILHALCDLRLESEDVLDLLKNLETESLRVEPLGYDDIGATYWYFYGTRLYREDRSHYHPFRRRPKEEEKKKKRKRKKSGDTDDENPPVWQVECFTEDDWSNLVQRFESCDSRLERGLLQTLKEDFLPEIPRLFEEKEKRRMMEFTSRRSSGRVQKLKEKKEEEERRLAGEITVHKKKKVYAEKKKVEEEEEKVERSIEAENETPFDKEDSFEELLHSLADDGKKTQEKRERKKRKFSHKEVQRKSDREEDVLQERKLSPQPPTEPVRNRKPYKRKEPKNHIRKHSHSKRNHRSRRDLVENFLEEVHATSDASNKENNCAGEVFSEADDCADFPEDSDKPKVFCGRKTNNSLSSLAFSLTPSTVVPEAATHIVNPSIMKKKVKSTHMLLQNEDELITGMYKILEHLGDHEDAWPFMESVDEAFAHNYYAVIRRPMYITKMEQRLDSGFYSSLSTFEADFKLMMDNCKLYNGPDSEYTHMAYNLERVFSKLKEKYLVTDFSSDDEICIDMSFDQSSKKKRKISHIEVEEVKDEVVKKKRGRKKKKVGRKPKNAAPEESPTKRKYRRSRTADESPNSTKFDVEVNKDKLSVSENSVMEDDDELDEAMLLVREDPYCNEVESDVEQYDYQNVVEVTANTDNFSDIEVKDKPKRKTATKADEQNGWMLDDEKSPENVTGKVRKGKRKHRKSTSRKKEKSPQKYESSHKVISSPTPVPSPFEEDRFINLKASDSDIDSDQDGVLLYYNNDPESEEETENIDKEVIEKVEYIDDVDQELLESPAKKHSSSKTKSIVKDKRKHRSPEKSHHHHRHHHHKNRGKEKERHHHHHKRKPKHSSEKDSPSKFLRAEEVYESEVDLPDESTIHEKEPEDLPIADEPSISQSKKKKGRRKTKHHKSTKHKVEKVTKLANTSKRKKKVPSKKLTVIDALSVVTEQTLKDITTLLDDPSVPRYNEEMTFNGSSDTPTKEYDSLAMKIEEEYRKKSQLDVPDDKKSSRKRKRKKDEPDKAPSRKKSKKEPKPEVNSDDKSEFTNLDNAKELFKDIKDGRIKPGAIIKSKDIAKKEGQVKKDTKSAVEGKVKAKQNPFGKINKQENTKLTTLIAKAKESRVGLVPNSEVGDSPKLSLGSILQFGDIGSCKHSSREPNSPEEDVKYEKRSEKGEITHENRWEKADFKDESSQSPEEEEETKEEVGEVCEDSPAVVEEELSEPSSVQEQEFKQDKATPNLSAWFKAFGGPKVGGSPRKKINGRLDEDEYLDVESDTEYGEEIDVGKDDAQITVDNDVTVNSPDSLPDNEPQTPHQPIRTSSPEPPVSSVKPPKTPWFHKGEEKIEDEPIWKKNKTEEDEDPYKFEEEELDRAREEAKKLEVERQRKASVSSSGLSDPSPLNIDSDRSPAAFSSEGERSPMTCSPSTRSPLTPGFGGTKQFSPVTEKSPGITAYSPRYDTSLAKGFSSNQTNGPIQVGFYQDMSDKSNQEKKDGGKGLDVKQKESPIYSPTVPYVSPFYPNKDQSIGNQKSPGRYGSFYSSIDSALDKPKTPGYTSSDKPSPVAQQNVTEEKQKNKYNYYNYDPTKPLTDQYKNTGSVANPFYGGNNNIEQSPGPNPSHTSMGSPVTPLGMQGCKSAVQETPDDQPPKKRAAAHRSQTSSDIEAAGDRRKSDRFTNKSDIQEIIRDARNESLMPLPGNLANLSQVVSRIPQPSLDVNKHPLHDNQRASSNYPQQPAKTVHHVSPYNPNVLPDLQHSIIGNRSNASRSSSEHNAFQELSLNQQLSVHPQLSPHLLGKEMPSLPIVDHQSISHLQPPVAHQKISDVDRPGSRNMPPPHHSSDKPLSYLHQKTMWTSSLPSSIASSLSSSLPSSLSSLVTSATMASFALAGQKNFGSMSPEQFAQLGVDRAALASFTGKSGQNSANLFSHDILQRTNQSSNGINSGSVLGGQNSNNGSGTHRSGGSSSNSSSASGSSSSSGTPSNNFDVGLARSYASIYNASQASPLLGRSDNALSRSLSGASSPFLPQSPGLGGALGLPGSSRTPTPAHQQSLNQASFPSISRDPRDPISQSHPSLQIPSLNSIGGGQTQTLNHLNAANLAYSSRDSLALINQGGRGPLVGPTGGLVDQTQQNLYTHYFRQHQLAQEELILRSAGAHGQLAAHQSMMFQQGLMSAAGYPAGYPHTLGLRSGSYQGMNRPWI